MFCQTVQAGFAADPPGVPSPGLPVRPPLDARFLMRRLALPTGVELALTWRDGTGLPLLFLPANRTSRRIFDFVLCQLRLANPVAVPDFRGLGESSAPEWQADTLDPHVADLVALVDALGWQHFAVVGQATGATLALLLATRLPDRVVAVVAGDAAVGLRQDVFDLFLDQVGRHDLGFATRAEALAATPFREAWAADVAEHWLDTALLMGADGRLRWRYDLPSIVGTQRALTADLWPAIQVVQPTLLLHGANCTVIGEDDMRRARFAIPQAQFARLEGANHRLTQDSPAAFAQRIEAFLRAEGVGG